jgi:tryptophan aminotransferase
MATHPDGILVSVSGVSTPVQANGHAVEKAVKSLPADFYLEFLSDAAKERKPSPSML